MNISLKRLAVPVIVILLLAACAQFFLLRDASAASSPGELIDIGDIKIYVEQHGKKDDKAVPIIFLHGGLGSARSWGHQVNYFSKNYPVITPESRGQGRSTDNDATLTYHLMAEDMVRLMDKLKIPSAYIVGWSDGGNIGIDMAIHHPSRVKKVVAYGANINPAGLQNHFLDYLRTVTPEKMQRDSGGDFLALSAHPEKLPIIVEKIRKMWLTEPQFTPAQLAGITTPILIMDGQQEELIRPDHAPEIAAAIPNAKLVMLPDVGHYATFKTAKLWNETVESFLKSN
ncbi:oxidoreductase [Cellvibrio zantedeschiae]|uniref:Oxidoreductase n=1 Tax=Cellvibrio zantedeschiae TaxID=1237077 RepID=A0ABQ3BC05_9GAMM|nr:alpha/beta hydrolase [Cellvibrio zantedeschiae]GGY83674.1 oxidoreductase [Cellvibrio zantedeschiae]